MSNLSEELQQPQWVACSDRLPEVGQHIWYVATTEPKHGSYGYDISVEWFTATVRFWSPFIIPTSPQ